MIKELERISRENFDSLYLFNEMYRIETETCIKLLKGLEWVNKNVDVIVIGGAAVCHYIQGRALTPDIDFLSQDIETIKCTLIRSETQYTELASNRGEPLGIHIPSLEIDILDSDFGNKELNKYILQKGYQTSKIAGYAMKIISPEILCLMKFHTGGRFKDEMDAFGLLQSGLLNKTTYLNTISDLFNSLNEADILKRYAGLIK